MLRSIKTPCFICTFKVTLKNGTLVDSTKYKVNFSKGILLLQPEVANATDSIIINYLRYPDFLTKDYFLFDPKVIVENTDVADKLVKLQQSNTENNFTPFDGLTTSGSITRGVTVGNNQNAVVNSELDLQITLSSHCDVQLCFFNLVSDLNYRHY